MKHTGARSYAYARLPFALLAVLTIWLLAVSAASAAQLTINVVGVARDGTQTPITTDYRWTVEEDTTKLSVPGRPATSANYSFSFHTSYMPVVAAGRVGTTRAHPACVTTATQPPPGCDPDVFRLYRQPLPNLDLARRYYVSIAADGYQMGGAPVVFSGSGAAATASATVYLNEYPLPTAQVSVFAFNDNSPINGAPDLPQEQGLAGFHVRLLEAGGTYGQSGGEVTQDAFGNPLGSTYDAAGNLLVKGAGIIRTDANGVAVIKNLFPAKYTVQIVPPVGTDWVQTSTIEGGKGIDAWVKNNEPTFFQEFGPPGHHVFIGFVRPGCVQGPQASGRCNGLPAGTGRTISGRVVDTHNSRPPTYTFFRGAPVANCWIGLNDPATQFAIYATACRKDSTFSIPNVPAGTYELVIWDEPLDVIISATTITVGAADLALGDLPVSSWFGRYQGRVFQDIDGTGLPFFHQPYSQPHIEVDPITGVEREVTTNYAAGALKPSFGEGIASNIRFRDGSIYQSTTTKTDGTFAFTEVFPFFNWMVAEIDYARFKATGATVVVDDGGLVDPVANRAKLWNAQKGLFGSNDPAISYDPWTRLNPQLQRTCSADDVANNRNPDGSFISTLPTACTVVGQTQYFRTENCSDTGGQCAILLEGMQTFLGQTNHVEWGKQPYNGTASNNGLVGENGGIAGIVHYAITRAEDDPRFAAAENWEPGVPRVQVNLFLDCDGDGKPDKPLNNGTGQCAAGAAGLSLSGYTYDQPDVDNYPFCWRDAEFVANNPTLCPNGQAMGPEDVKRSRTGGTAFSYGDVFRWGAPNQPAAAQTEIGLSKTDSWDDSVPTACPDSGGQYRVPSTGEPLDCFDGLRNFNQMRPSVFDGGYAFGRVAGQPELPMFIGAEGKGTYIVEAVAPPGYLHQGNGDKNVVFGDSLQASTAALPFQCVGMELPVPEFLSLFPDAGNPDSRNPNYDAGQRTWRKCDMKAVPLLPGANPAPDFYLFTEAPVAGHGVGFILDDTAAEFNHFAPNFGEKYSPPHLPVSIKDWTGREISRVYSDQFGSYNFLVPSTFTINPPYPSGVMPSMMVACMNDPGPINRDPVTGVPYAQPQLDPFYNRRYTTFCYTLQYLPGKTTYLDTPVLPVAAFAPIDKNPLDCECADGTPGIFSATNGDNGPWVPTTGGTLTIVSQGRVSVTNPAFDPSVVLGPAPVPPVPGITYVSDPADPRLQKTIQRDYGFGTAAGTVTLDGSPPLVGVGWSDGVLTVPIPSGSAGARQLMIRRAGATGKESVVGLTVHVGGNAPRRVNLAGTNGAHRTIQAAVDAAAPGELITIAPGTYNEYVIVDKRVRLQGWGAGSVAINAAKSSAGGLAAWRALVNRKIDARCGTPTGSTNIANCPPGTPIDPDTGRPTLVAGVNRTFDLLPGQTLGTNVANNEPLLFGAEEGAGILIVGRSNANGSNCADSATALRVDGVTITGSDAGGGVLASGYVCNLQVTNNRIVGNYGTYGGGVRVGHTVLLAADNSFTDGVNRTPNIHHNWISQNGSTEAGGGGGVTLGTGSNGYTVADNYVCGNFSMANGGGLSHLGASPGANAIARNKFLFNQTFNQSADPMGGGLSIAGQVPVAGGAAAGTGDVTVNANLFQGNQAGAGAGGAVSVARTISGNNAANTDDIVLTNNMIVNNVAAYAGGGVSLSGNGSGVRLVNNTIASNVSTATGRQAFGPQGPSLPSLPQIAGVAVLDGTSPALLNNIIWGNRQFIYLISGTTTGLFNPGTTSVAAPSPTPSYRDLGRVGQVGNDPTLTPASSLFTTGATGFTPSATNRFAAATAGTTLFVAPIGFLSIIDPTQPVVLQDSTVALQSALTFDETGNFINVIFSPLTPWNASGTAPRADYHLAAGSTAINGGANRTGSNFVPLADYDGDARASTAADPVDIGADEVAGSVTPPPTLPALTVLDNFNRANANTLGANWQQLVVAGAASIRVNGNQASCPTLACLLGGNATWSAASFGANQAAAMQIGVGGSTVVGDALVLKASGTYNTTLGLYPNQVRVRVNSATQVVVETTTNGVLFTSAGTLTTSLVASDVLTAQVNAAGVAYVWKTTNTGATTTTTYIGTVQLPTTGANAFTTGPGQVGIYLPPLVGARVDNFAGGTATVN